ncbi:MAG: hypothetical protein KDC07_06895 [Chitinophagaceae bacterium]|nr:hypothetical protein [Chitinophagaceae bacterium]MCB9047020.1 hypothetical protein [Chitinophagales bacterium]
MNRLFPVWIGLLLSVLTISSCCHKKVYCTSETLDFAFTGFDRNEVRNFTLRRFAKDNPWGEVLDSAQFIYYGSAAVTLKPDTLQFSDYRTIGNLDGITSDNDWAIYLPATGKIFYFTTIFDDNNKSQLVRCGDDNTTCSKAITYFSINNDWQRGDFLYLQKGRW